MTTSGANRERSDPGHGSRGTSFATALPSDPRRYILPRGCTGWPEAPAGDLAGALDPAFVIGLAMARGMQQTLAIHARGGSKRTGRSGSHVQT